MTDKATHKLKVKSTKELTEEFKIVVETNECLQLKVKELEAQLKIVIEKLNDSDKSPVSSSQKGESGFKCEECGDIFLKKSLLKRHRQENHRKNVSCEECGETFDQHWKLEVHLKTHDTIDKFTCNICQKTFQVKWRLRKHMDMHINKNVKKCHFFNNDKTCPFEEIGCKFVHEVSAICFFKDNCTNKLCPFKHSLIQIEEENHACEQCNFTSGKSADVNNHIRSNHTEDSEKESIKGDLKEIKESDAKKHLEKGQKFYCGDCLFRTSSQNEFKEHVKRRQHKEKQ